jgi:hypothetical protein
MEDGGWRGMKGKMQIKQTDARTLGGSSFLYRRPAHAAVPLFFPPVRVHASIVHKSRFLALILLHLQTRPAKQIGSTTPVQPFRQLSLQGQGCSGPTSPRARVVAMSFRYGRCG